MIKSLLRIHCTEFHLLYQAAVCYRTILMSESAGKPPPIGAFVINPLPVNTGSQSNVCVTSEKENVGSVSSKSTYSKKNEVGNMDSCVIESQKLLKINKDDKSCGNNRGANEDKRMQKHANDESQDIRMESSVPSSLQNTDSFNTGISQLSGTHDIISPGPTGMSDTNSKLMMNLTLSGPPKGKFDQKKTVLPPSLLQGVTELVRKEQVNQDNVSVLSSEEKSHSNVGGRAEMFDFKSKSQCNAKEKNKEDKYRKQQSVDGTENKVADVDNLHGNTKEMLVTESVGIRKSLCEKQEQETNISAPREASELAQTITHESSDIPVKTSESYGMKDKVESACSDLSDKARESNSTTHLARRNDSREITQNNDIRLTCAVSEAELAMSKSIDKISASNPLNVLGLEHELNPCSEMDLDDLLNGDLKHSNTSIGPHENKEKKSGNSDAEFKMCSEELLHVDSSVLGKKSTKPEDNVYNLSDLFSGELEKRRRQLLHKEKRQAKKFERFSKKKKKSVDTETTDKTDTGDKEEKPRRQVPNYFVAIQIADQKIKSGLKAVQDKVVLGNKRLQPALNKLATLHLTMMVLRLETQEDMERSRQALDKASEKLLSQYVDMSLQLDVSGLGHFRNNVVFANVKHEHQISTLKNVADIVEECFMEQEVISPDKRGFKPHITIMKLSSVKGNRKKGLKKIDEKLYSDFVDTDFGCETINMLQLCAMMKPKDKQGYYQVEHRVQFAKKPDSDTAKPGPDTTGENPDQHNEITEETDKDIAAHIVENMKDFNGRKGDATDEARNKLNDPSDLSEKDHTESIIKTETEYVTSTSCEQGDENRQTELQVECSKQDTLEYASDVVEETVILNKENASQKENIKENNVQKEFTEDVEEVTQLKSSLQIDRKKMNLDISAGTRIKDLNLEDEGNVDTLVNLVTDVSNKTCQPEVDEIGESTEGSHANLNVINAEDISVELETPQVKEITKELSIDDDSAIDISVDIETSKLSDIDTSVDNDSVLSNSVDS